MKIYVNKTENRITLKVKTEYYLELLTPETTKLLGSTKNEITKDKNAENVQHPEITEVVQFTVILLIMIINQIQEPCIHLFQIVTI